MEGRNSVGSHKGFDNGSVSQIVKSSDASCGDLNIEIHEKYTDRVNIPGVNRTTDHVFSKSISLVKMCSMSTVRCND